MILFSFDSVNLLTQLKSLKVHDASMAAQPTVHVLDGNKEIFSYSGNTTVVDSASLVQALRETQSHVNQFLTELITKSGQPVIQEPDEESGCESGDDNQMDSHADLRKRKGNGEFQGNQEDKVQVSNKKRKP